MRNLMSCMPGSIVSVVTLQLINGEDLGAYQ